MYTMQNPPPNLQKAYDTLLSFAVLPDTIHLVERDNTEARLTLGGSVIIRLKDEVTTYGHSSQWNSGIVIELVHSFSQDPAKAYAFGQVYATAMVVVRAVEAALKGEDRIGPTVL